MSCVRGVIWRSAAALGCCCLALAVAACWLGAQRASAEDCSTCRPWWHIATVSAPASEAGKEGQVVVEATNLGDKVADGRLAPMVVADTLPAGVEPTAVFGEGGGGQSGDREQREHSHCAIVLQTVVCTYEWPLMPYERLSVAIHVKVTPGAGRQVNEVSVSGGGAAEVVSKRALGMEAPAPSFGMQTYEVTPEQEGGSVDTLAGSHPFQMTATFLLNARTVTVTKLGKEEQEVQPPALTKDLSFELPAGLVGNPTATERCDLSVFVQEASNKSSNVKCPRASVVGVATSITNRLSTGGAEQVTGTLTEPVYNLQPGPGEPARFGFVTPTPVGVVLDTSIRTGKDYGVTVSTTNITQLAAFIGSQVTFWGDPSDSRHDTQRGTECLAGIAAERYVEKGVEESCPLTEPQKPFLIMPTLCSGAPSTRVVGDSWSEPGVFTHAEYTFPLRFDGCDKLGFQPSISISPDVTDGSTPSGLTADVHVPQDASLNPKGQAESAVKQIKVTLPEGVAVNASGADGLEACSESLVGAGKEAEWYPGVEAPTFTPTLPNPLLPGVNFCPDGSKVATVEVSTPLLPKPLVGDVYLAAQEVNPFGSLIAMYLVAEDAEAGVLVKLAGEVKLTSTGQIETTFENPPLPFEDAVLKFFGGARAPLVTPAACGSYTTMATFTPWSGNPQTNAAAERPFLINSGPNGAPCANPLPFSPSLTGGSTNIQAGSFTPFATTLNRSDGQQELSSVQLHMPPGLSGMLTGVKLCGEAEGNAGTCGSGSLIGETTVSVGAGGNPFSVKGGKVYLTGPYRGAPFGLSIVNPAKAGPFDLEKTKAQHPACDCVVVRAKVEVDPTTAALTVTTDPEPPYNIPTTIEGIPLQIQHVNVTINRPGFTFNPTDCNPMKISGTLRSAKGADSPVSLPFQVTNCATLGFKPRFSVSTSAHTSRVRGASLDTKLSYPKNSMGTLANISEVKVDLPKQLPSRLSTLQKACTAATFAENPAKCPAASKVGSARATTPILPVPLEGPAYFVSHGGAKFPELIIVLQGYGVTVDLHGETFINVKTNVTSSTFRSVPDVPVGTFELKLPEGPKSALAATSNLCKAKLRMPTAFTAQNGLVIHQSTKITVTGCPKRVKSKAARNKHGR